MDAGGDFSDEVRSLVHTDQHFGAPEEIILLVIEGLVVLIEARLDNLLIHTDQLRDVSDRVALRHQLLSRVVLSHLVLRVDGVVDHEVSDSARLLQFVSGHHVARQELIREALAVLVQQEAAAGTHRFRDQSAVLLDNGRVNLDLLDVGEASANLLGEDDAVTGSARVVRRGEALQFRTILLNHLVVRAKTAGRENHSLRVDGFHSLRSLHLDAGHLAVLHQDLRHAVIETHVDMILIRAFAKHTHNFDTDRRTIARTMTAGTGLAAAATHTMAEVSAEVEEPFFSGGSVFRQSLDERRVIQTVAAADRISGEAFRRVVRDAVSLLLLRAGGVHFTFGAVGVAAEVGHLLKHDNLGALFGRGDGGGQASAARTDNDDVGGFSGERGGRHHDGKHACQNGLFHFLSQRFEFIDG